VKREERQWQSERASERGREARVSGEEKSENGDKASPMKRKTIWDEDTGLAFHVPKEKDRKGGGGGHSHDRQQRKRTRENSGSSEKENVEKSRSSLGMSLIMPGLWIGNQKAASEKVLQNGTDHFGLGFTHVLDLTGEDTPSRSSGDVTGMVIDASLSPVDTLKTHAREKEGPESKRGRQSLHRCRIDKTTNLAVPEDDDTAPYNSCITFLERASRFPDVELLMFCESGNIASVALMLGYLIQKRLFGLIDSVKYLSWRRPTIELDSIFLSQLIYIESMMETCMEYPRKIPGFSSKTNSRESQLIDQIYNIKDQAEEGRRRRIGGTADFDQIIENVYLGDLNAGREAAMREGPCSKLGITDVIDCSNDDLYDTKSVQTPFCKLHMEDDGDTDLSANNWRLVRQALEFIERGLARKNGRVLIHCAAGINRSATICAAWLMHKFRWTARKALHHIVSRRFVVFPRMDYIQMLVDWEAKLWDEGGNRSLVDLAERHGVDDGNVRALMSAVEDVYCSDDDVQSDKAAAADDR